jgi:ATP-dependent DNA helicase PIF1
MQLTTDQQKAWQLLNGESNVFLTGLAGTGKSFLINRFLDHSDETDRFISHRRERYPILASTGAAAILIGGRTFHSFFGLGAMQVSPQIIIERAANNRYVRDRLSRTFGIIIDEVSMLDGRTLSTAEQIARVVRRSDKPWGGLRVIAVGDFAQLPPVSKKENQPRDWAFKSNCWLDSSFERILLRKVMRTSDVEFLEVLSIVREGKVDPKVAKFLNAKVTSKLDDKVLRLYSRKSEVEIHNLKMLSQLPGKEFITKTRFWGKNDMFLDAIKKNCPVPEILRLKIGAKVMTRINNGEVFANGSVGTITDARFETRFGENGEVHYLPNTLAVEVEFDHSGQAVWISPHRFKMEDADGELIAYADTFPMQLAYACTIHKSQGMSLDHAVVDLRSLWEPGQAYVALSRLKTAEGLKLINWFPRSIIADEEVTNFYRSFE